MSQEPSVELAHSPLRFMLATRPAFLSISLLGACLGLSVIALSLHLPPIQWSHFFLFLAAVLVFHAAANVLNDVYDHENGTDAYNTHRIFPFTGGSRFIQNGILSSDKMARLGWGLFGLGFLLGSVVCQFRFSALASIGFIGAFLAWAYSAPPFKLNSRGLGELTVACSFALLIPAAYYASTQAQAVFPLGGWLVAFSFGGMVSNLLYMNQFPDAQADSLAGKHHWVVRLGAKPARWGYLIVCVVSQGLVLVGVALAVLPWSAVFACLSLVPAGRAASVLWRYAETPNQLGEAIRLSILAAHLHAVLLIGGIVWPLYF